MQTVPVVTIALLTIHCILLSGGQISAAKTLADRLSLNNIKALEKLCPRVDICIRNASEPVVRRNRILEDGILVSMCHGCSCHKDCQGMINCCFPDDGEEVVDDATAVTPLLANISSDNHTTTPSTIDNVITPEDGTTSMRQCLYSRTGVPDNSWIDKFPAYRIISKAPIGGCKSEVQSNGGVREDPCGSGIVAPWGDLYPVYSSDHGVIYKNSLCASCHGAYDFEHMDAVLVCDIQDEITGRFLSALDHLKFLQQDGSSQYCFISFGYEDKAMLHDNLCFVDTIKSCSEDFNDDNSFRIPDGVNITHEEVRNACHSGLNAPVLEDHAYRNAFCAICNNEVGNLYSLQEKYGYYSNGKSFWDRKTAYLLDLSLLLDYDNLEKSAGKTTPFPEVCLYDGASREKENCREVFCPSAQLRHRDGFCRYPSRTWYTDFFEVTVKLTHVKGKITVDDLLNAGQHDANDIFEHIRATSPWPSRWEVNRVLLSSDDAGTGPSMAVDLIVDIKNPSVVFQTLQVVMVRSWVLSVKGIDIVFNQSFFEYSLRFSFGAYIPKWKVNANDSIPQISNTTATTFWNINPIFKRYPFAFRISKLFTCESVALSDGEYTLIANDLVLINNLTGKVMFDREFELVGQENGRLAPRVCVSDTPLRLNSSCALFLSGMALPFVMVSSMGLYYLN